MHTAGGREHNRKFCVHIGKEKQLLFVFPSTTTINVPVIFCHTDTEWNSWPLKNNEEILTIEWKKKKMTFLKRHRGRQIRYGTNINLVNSFSLTDLLPTSRHQTLMIFPKKSFYWSWSSLKKISCSFWLTALQLMQTCAPFLLSWPQLSLWCFRPQCRKQQPKKLCDVADTIFLDF